MTDLQLLNDALLLAVKQRDELVAALTELSEADDLAMVRDFQATIHAALAKVQP